MDRFAFADFIRRTSPMPKEEFILGHCRGKDVVDLGCIRHSADFATKDPNWRHKKIAAAAKTILGVDYLPEEVAKLKKLGYNIVHGDVSKPLAIDAKFDVVNAGDIIEHLTNFDAFFDNCDRLLKPDGVLVMTTGNPFYMDGLHYAAMKGCTLVNPEHTCWMDPQTLIQLAERFGYRIEEFHFEPTTWNLKNFLFDTPAHPYDIVNDRWDNDSYGRKVLRKVCGLAFAPVYAVAKLLMLGCAPLVAHSDYMATFKKVR